MGHKYLYKTTSLAGLVQQTMFLVTKGYYYFCIVHYPAHKQDKWNKIDSKLIAKYQTNMTRSQRYRNTEKKLANFMFLRFQNVAVILMATKKFEGKKTKTREGITIDDEFYDVREKHLTLEVGRMTGLKIHSVDEGTFTVSMTNAMYEDVAANLKEVAKQKDLAKAQYEFCKLNGLPPWAGINEQKFKLLDLLVRELKRHNVKAKKTEFFVKLKRKSVKVFE